MEVTQYTLSKLKWHINFLTYSSLVFRLNAHFESLAQLSQLLNEVLPVIALHFDHICVKSFVVGL